MAESRSRVRKNSNKSPQKKKKGLKIGLLILVVLLTVFGLYIWKVYSDVTGTTEKIYKNVDDKEEVRNSPVNIDKSDSFSVLMLGVDTGDLGRTEQGRSDTMMVMTINPRTNTSKIVSIPRDTYTEIVGKGTMDKINHAYAFGGTAMAMNTVQKLLDIPIDYYVEVNMQGVQDLVDTVGGVNVTSPLTFDYDGYSFIEGQTKTLGGAEALAFSRMRYEDPEGDYGRQKRQRQVLEAIVKKAATFSTITNYKDVLGTMENNLQTNLAFEDMVDIFSKYRSATSNIEQIQLEGTGIMLDNISYQQVSEEELNRVSTLLKEQLEID
ncbi:transcriptional attenuator, LytR family [Carnobacterium iners]|uniref:Transcriptional attenuator, LytR family n=1 Tax=Carnobacterium iners TaxID=1073423 RepID=A0A1X7NAM0_9LACT|nr:LCP family protein [Carnobacterium iners]SEL20743.1 transcriptional attenuator, LytR family [Carnobacterium iners]SMH33810.1 transcriptional attenuator, LytR family [Carnobacterium iners]